MVTCGIVLTELGASWRGTKKRVLGFKKASDKLLAIKRLSPDRDHVDIFERFWTLRDTFRDIWDITLLICTQEVCILQGFVFSCRKEASKEDNRFAHHLSDNFKRLKQIK